MFIVKRGMKIGKVERRFKRLSLSLAATDLQAAAKCQGHFDGLSCSRPAWIYLTPPQPAGLPLFEWLSLPQHAPFSLSFSHARKELGHRHRILHTFFFFLPYHITLHARAVTSGALLGSSHSI